MFYVVGASFVQSFVTYPTWRLVGANEFRASYQELSGRIVRIMILPGLLEILLTVALFWLRPLVIPRWPVALALVLTLARFGLTAQNQMQVQQQIGLEGLSPPAIDAMIHRDDLAQATSIVRALLYLWMGSVVLGEATQRVSAAGPASRA